MTHVVERRELTAAERHVDVGGLVAALEQAKLDLHAAIIVEQRRAARQAMRGQRARLVVTPRMAAVLARLYQRGVQAAHQEAASMGVELRKTFEAEPAPIPDGTQKPYLRLRVLLGALSKRINDEHAARHELYADTRPEMLRALNRVPGALDAAGRVVSKALMTGMGDVFAANADAFSGWQASAVLDGGTCGPCEENDGHVYATWTDAMDDLPDGGPYVGCLGEDRCRCRLVPIA